MVSPSDENCGAEAIGAEAEVQDGMNLLRLFVGASIIWQMVQSRSAAQHQHQQHRNGLASFKATAKMTITPAQGKKKLDKRNQ